VRERRRLNVYQSRKLDVAMEVVIRRVEHERVISFCHAGRVPALRIFVQHRFVVRVDPLIETSFKRARLELRHSLREPYTRYRVAREVGVQPVTEQFGAVVDTASRPLGAVTHIPPDVPSALRLEMFAVF